MWALTSRQRRRSQPETTTISSPEPLPCGIGRGSASDRISHSSGVNESRSALQWLSIVLSMDGNTNAAPAVKTGTPRSATRDPRGQERSGATSAESVSSLRMAK
jgi:hypothetical protein